LASYLRDHALIPCWGSGTSLNTHRQIEGHARAFEWLEATNIDGNRQFGRAASKAETRLLPTEDL
jgi:hypothetical protein